MWTGGVSPCFREQDFHRQQVQKANIQSSSKQSNYFQLRTAGQWWILNGVCVKSRHSRVGMPLLCKRFVVFLYVLGLEGNLESIPSSVTSSWLKCSSAISELQVPDCQTPLEAGICMEPPWAASFIISDSSTHVSNLLEWVIIFSPLLKKKHSETTTRVLVSLESRTLGKIWFVLSPIDQIPLAHWQYWEFQGLKWWEYFQRNPKGLWGFGGKVNGWVELSQMADNAIGFKCTEKQARFK